MASLFVVFILDWDLLVSAGVVDSCGCCVPTSMIFNLPSFGDASVSRDAALYVTHGT